MADRRETSRDVKLWFHSLKISGLTATILGLVLVAALVLTPSFSTYLQQQREIAQLRESVAMHEQALADIEEQQLKWKDPVYIRAQARERLFYVLPGEVQLTVIEDGVVIPEDTKLQATTELQSSDRDWARDFAVSMLGAGTTDKAPEELFVAP